MTIAACVLSLPERAHLLTECLAAIHAQTRLPDDIVVGIDPYRLGEADNANRLEQATNCDWVAWCHSDDLWHPDHLAVMEAHCADADVVVSRFDLVNRPWGSIEPWHENFEDQRFTQWIGSPSMVMTRKGTWPGWREPQHPYRWVDHTSYNVALDDGCRFVDTKTVTTDYRFMGGNGSWTP